MIILQPSERRPEGIFFIPWDAWEPQHCQGQEDLWGAFQRSRGSRTSSVGCLCLSQVGNRSGLTAGLGCLPSGSPCLLTELLCGAQAPLLALSFMSNRWDYSHCGFPANDRAREFLLLRCLFLCCLLLDRFFSEASALVRLGVGVGGRGKHKIISWRSDFL